MPAGILQADSLGHAAAGGATEGGCGDAMADELFAAFERFASEEWRVRHAAADELTEIRLRYGTAAAPAISAGLAEASRDKRWRVRAMASRVLSGECAEPPAAQVCKATLDRPGGPWKDRMNAVESIACMRPEQVGDIDVVMRQFERLSKEDPAPVVRMAALTAVGHAALRGHGGAEGAVSAVEAALTDSEPLVRKEATRLAPLVCDQLPGDKSLILLRLVLLLTDSCPAVRRGAAAALDETPLGRPARVDFPPHFGAPADWWAWRSAALRACEEGGVIWYGFRDSFSERKGQTAATTAVLRDVVARRPHGLPLPIYRRYGLDRFQESDQRLGAEALRQLDAIGWRARQVAVAVLGDLVQRRDYAIAMQVIDRLPSMGSRVRLAAMDVLACLPEHCMSGPVTKAMEAVIDRLDDPVTAVRLRAFQMLHILAAKELSPCAVAELFVRRAMFTASQPSVFCDGLARVAEAPLNGPAIASSATRRIMDSWPSLGSPPRNDSRKCDLLALFPQIAPHGQLRFREIEFVCGVAVEECSARVRLAALGAVRGMASPGDALAREAALRCAMDADEAVREEATALLELLWQLGQGSPSPPQPALVTPPCFPWQRRPSVALSFTGEEPDGAEREYAGDAVVSLLETLGAAASTSSPRTSDDAAAQDASSAAAAASAADAADAPPYGTDASSRHCDEVVSADEDALEVANADDEVVSVDEDAREVANADDEVVSADNNAHEVANADDEVGVDEDAHEVANAGEEVVSVDDDAHEVANVVDDNTSAGAAAAAANADDDASSDGTPPPLTNNFAGHSLSPGVAGRDID